MPSKGIGNGKYGAVAADSVGQSWGESHSEECARRSKFHLDLQL